RKGKTPLKPEDVLRPAGTPQAFVPSEDDEDGEGGSGKTKAKGGAAKGAAVKGVVGRDQRQQARNERARQRKSREELEIVGGRAAVLLEDRPDNLKRLHRLKKRQPITMPRKGKTALMMPITVRALSEALGIKSVELLFKLRDHGAGPTTTLNSTL